MFAKVIDSHRWKTVTAFGSQEFVKNEWRAVPKGSEKEAKAHPFLEIKRGAPVISFPDNGIPLKEEVDNQDLVKTLDIPGDLFTEPEVKPTRKKAGK